MSFPHGKSTSTATHAARLTDSVTQPVITLLSNSRIVGTDVEQGRSAL